MDHIFTVCGKIYPKVLGQLDYAAKKANTVVDYQELIEELHCAYCIQETSRKKLDDDEMETDVALSAVNFRGKCLKCGKIGHKANNCANLIGSNSNLNGNASNLNGTSTGGSGNSSHTNNRKFQENATIVVPRDTKRLTVGRRKRMLTSTQKVGRGGILELRLMLKM